LWLSVCNAMSQRALVSLADIFVIDVMFEKEQFVL